MRLRQIGLTGGFVLVGVLLAVVLVLIRPPRVQAPTAVGQSGASVSTAVTRVELAKSEACSGAFVTHALDFATGMRLREINTYISNGSGVAVNDLDNDGYLDLVFASVDRESAILWNRGGLHFEAEPLDDRFTRAVAVVDVDGDGWLDIVFTHRGLEGVSHWRNLGVTAGKAQFARASLPGIESYAYAMAWGDLDRDGDLDIVTGSYGAELIQHGIDDPAQDPRAGLFLHVQQNGAFTSQQLDTYAETLSIGVLDVEFDGQAEIWVANDFALRDYLWHFEGDGWAKREPFAETSHSTMSLDWGEITPGKELALFSTDMNPRDISPATLAKWLPVMQQITPHREQNDPQIMANVLAVRPVTSNSLLDWRNEATRRGVDASGWSWAGRLGDLNSDGSQDIYIVNGMIASDMFGHLPNGELVEENLAYRNRGNGVFDPAQEWGLGSTASGRGMVMADLDEDGDLDIVVNNLRNRAQVFENQLCAGANLEVELHWPDSQNRRAIGAQVRLVTDGGVQWRDVRASGGYLSGDPTRVHFGFPADVRLDALVVIWPDGAHSQVDAPQAQSRMTLIREESQP
jgi:hypothetical protein